MKQLVKLNKRPSRDGRTFTYLLRYDGENGKPLDMETCEKLKGNVLRRKRSLGWVMLSPAL